MVWRQKTTGLKQMKNEKITDKILREKLENFSMPPAPQVWDNIQAQLAARKRNNRMIIIGWISAAAVLVLAFMAGWYFNDNLKTEKVSSVNKEIIQSEKTTKPEFAAQPEKQGQNLTAKNINENSEKPVKITPSTELTLRKKETIGKGKEDVINTREVILIGKLESINAEVAGKKLPNHELAQNSKKVPENYLTESELVLVAQNVKNMKETTKPDNKWKMGLYVSPGYSSQVANHSDNYSENMTYSGSDGNSNVGGGFSVQYKTSKRWIVESGVYYAQNGQQSNNNVNIFSKNMDSDALFAPGDITYLNNSVKIENNNLTMNSTAGVIQFDETPKGAELSGDFEASKTNNVNLLVPNGEFSQVFDFMEIPLFVRYRVIDTKIGVELITGVNAGIVVGNNAYIENQYGLQNIGETQDISPVNLSGTVGVGVNYALGKHFFIAFEPRFNYYLSSINSNPSVEFRPYRLGFFTGVTYEF